MTYNGNGTDDEGDIALPVPGILAIADCFEPESENQKLIDLAIGCVAAMGTDVTILDLRDLELPDYSEVSDPGNLPQGAHAFRQLLCAHDGFLIALPSGLGSHAPLLLNAIAWSTCPAFGGESVMAYNGKFASLMSGTGDSEMLQRILTDVADELTRLGVLVLPDVLVIAPSSLSSDTDIAYASDIQAKLESQMQTFIGTIRWAQSHSNFDV